jgi:stress-induced morphogen
VFGKNNAAGARGQRRSTRRPTFFRGKIVHCDGSYSYNCVIRDMSESGARIEISQSGGVPEKLFLLGSGSRTAFEAEVVWKKQTFAGLRFIREHDLVSSTDLRMLRLRFHATELSRSGATAAV